MRARKHALAHSRNLVPLTVSDRTQRRFSSFEKRDKVMKHIYIIKKSNGTPLLVLAMYTKERSDSLR